MYVWGRGVGKKDWGMISNDCDTFVSRDFNDFINLLIPQWNSVRRSGARGLAWTIWEHRKRQNAGEVHIQIGKTIHWNHHLILNAVDGCILVLYHAGRIIETTHAENATPSMNNNLEKSKSMGTSET